VNARIQAGHNVLITGIGGGVALLALQICIAAGANVYVTSGTKEKIDRAVELGAKGGANYKDSKSHFRYIDHHYLLIYFHFISVY
jgi:NADPH:quinone reductase-like Zn-dependent oxidoreductase